MFIMWDKMAQDRRVINLMAVFLGCTLITTIALCACLYNATREQTIYIPPAIDTGVYVKAGTVDKSNVFNFAFNVWQLLNYWEKDGEANSKENIQRYKHYLSPGFKKQLEREANKNESKYKNRTRQLQVIHEGGHYEENNVIELSSSSWVVYLKLRIIETYHNEVVKDKKVVYPLRIERVIFNREVNPFDLIISGFYENTKIL